MLLALTNSECQVWHLGQDESSPFP